MHDSSACVKLAIFDLDGTVTNTDTFKKFLIYILVRRPIRWPRVANLLIGLFLFILKARSNSWLKEKYLYHIVGGLGRSQIKSLVNGFNKRVMSEMIRADALTRINGHKKDGAIVVLATASPSLYVNDLAESLGISEVIATECEIDGHGVVTGRLEGQNCYGQEKLRKLMAAFPILDSGDSDSNNSVLFYSDHHSDLPLLEFATKAVVVCPTAALKSRAIEAGFKIEYWN